MAPEDAYPTSYQRWLRAIGAYLDREELDRFRLIEEPGAYTVLVERRAQHPALQAVRIEHATLDQQAEQLIRGRRVFGTRRLTPWSLSPGGREDVLRALGYELDDVEARGLSVDELDDGLLLTYGFVDASRGFVARKRMVILRARDLQEMLDVAYSRRQRRGVLGLLRR